MKHFLSTTAVLLTMSGAALADTQATGFGTVTADTNDFFATDLIGMRIYNSETAVENDAMVADGAEKDWDDIGEINDMIISSTGEVRAVVLGVGGFLGMGEHDVTVSMDAIKVVREEGDSNDRFLVVNTSKEMLEQAPEFHRTMVGDMPAADNNAANTNVVAGDDARATSDTMDMAERRTLLAPPTVSRAGFQDARWDEMTADDLEGAQIYGVNDEDVGNVDKLIVDDDGKITDVVADIGGFLGMGEHSVKLSFEELQIVRKGDTNNFRIYVDSTEDQLKSLPEANE